MKTALWTLAITLPPAIAVLLALLCIMRSKFHDAQRDIEVLEWHVLYVTVCKWALHDYIAYAEGISYKGVTTKTDAMVRRLMSLPHLMPVAPWVIMPKHLQDAAISYNARQSPWPVASLPNNASAWLEHRTELLEQVLGILPGKVLDNVDAISDVAQVDIPATLSVLREVIAVMDKTVREAMPTNSALCS